MHAVDEAIPTRWADEVSTFYYLQISVAIRDSVSGNLPYHRAHSIQVRIPGPRFMRRINWSHYQNWRIWVLTSDYLDERSIYRFQGFNCCVVLCEVQDKAGGVNICDCPGYRRFAFPISGKPKIDKIHIEQATQYAFIAHTRSTGACTLRD